MPLKQFSMNKILLILFSFVCSNGLVQDVIVKKDGSTILSKVLEVNTSEIKYKKNLDQHTQFSRPNDCRLIIKMEKVRNLHRNQSAMNQT